MKKVLSKNKGFAMAELLAVCVVVLGLFSILFSNYLPLLAEYENRLSYNDVTAEYAAHYVRKAYVENPDFRQKSKEQKTFLTSIFDQSKGYYTIYDKKNNIKDFCFGTGAGAAIINGCSELTSKLTNIIDQYKIEEIIVSRYQLGDLTGDYGKVGLKDKMEAANTGSESYNEDGLLYNYIKYLPSYAVKAERNKITTGNTDEMYRIILKTKDFGYATTSIRSNFVVKDSCLVATDDSTSDGIYIADFVYNDECIKDADKSKGIIEISNDEMHTMETVSGNTVVGKIVGIADGKEASKQGVFTPGYNAGNTKYQDESGNYNIMKINFLNNVNLKKIGSYAFYETNLVNFDIGSDPIIADNSGSGLTADTGGLIIGDYAFAKTALTNVGIATTIPGSSKKVVYGKGVFSGNSKLETVSLASINDNNCYNDYNGRYYDPNDPEKKDTDIGFVKSGISEYIGDSMFSGCSSSVSNGLNLLNNGSKIQKFRTNMFNNTKLSSYDFSDYSSLKFVGDTAFADVSVSGSKTLKLPSSIKKLFVDSFSGNKMITTVEFPQTLTSSLIVHNKSFLNTNVAELHLPINNVGVYLNKESFSGSKIVNLFIPNGTTINQQAFAGGDTIKTIKFGVDGNSDEKVIVNKLSFQNLRNLECIMLGDGIKNNSFSLESFQSSHLPSYIVNNSSYYNSASDWCGAESSGVFSAAIYYVDADAPTECSLEDNVLKIGNSSANLVTENDDTVKEACRWE